MASFMREIFGDISGSGAAHKGPGPAKEGDDLAHLDARLAGAVRSGSDGTGIVMLQPAECVVWDGNPRDVPRLTPEGCRSLIESIATEGGNRIPVLVRRAGEGAEIPYELLVGSRRRFAVDWLNHNGRPELRLSALIVDVSDEEAFRIADLENRERADISEIDRARSYQAAVDRFYGGVQSKMAQALSLSNSQLSRLLSLAQLPEDVVEAFPARTELRVRHSEVLTPLLRRPELRAAIIDAAIAIAAQQQQRTANKQPLIAAAAVLSKLRQAAVSEPSKPEPVTLMAGGTKVGVMRHGRGGVVDVSLSVGGDVDVESLLAELGRRLREAQREGMTRAA
ncbi:chromosome partitioning protein ParB [Rhizorhabdus wittichii DC-6]|jgi:ParB family chromosome partitioning protein|uniref:ParB-like partition protein n=3 Tax=Rhizorhabdus wittichii TaxID=160791 RepID=A0A9J9HEB4_RHIWR|nr:ParB/RepB/Spo0J family partition protein [Rhizorhabdus wittichii]ABQ69849.1 parB-like partition protein [Rhizorhabdus wittichii RW1]ARR53170.1 chromosome partitioning protein ParB [Rhizorhabdus wittichii DC-6]QTH19547.1 ParB/RepB/Spo0J family partition protein [Rhizorhabdus wittichii]